MLPYLRKVLFVIGKLQLVTSLVNEFILPGSTLHVRTLAPLRLVYCSARSAHDTDAASCFLLPVLTPQCDHLTVSRRALPLRGRVWLQMCNTNNAYINAIRSYPIDLTDPKFTCPPSNVLIWNPGAIPPNAVSAVAGLRMPSCRGRVLQL